VAAPFIPFLSDAVYQELATEKMAESVHLSDFPEADAHLRDEELEQEMAAAQLAVSLGHSLRKEYKLKVRQPLQKALLISSNEQLLASLDKQRQLIGDELNVKTVELHADEAQFVQWIAKPNFPVLGKKIGKLMQQAQKTIGAFDRKQILSLRQGQSLQVEIGGEQVILELADVQIERKVKESLAAGNEGDVTVVLDTTLDEDLLLEGLARELVNKINTMRRELGFEVTDRIHLSIQTTARVQQAFEQHKAYIMNETLALQVHFGPCEGTPWDLNGEATVILIHKVEVTP
jgi:isoleucyl-tRNA synthetase